MQSATVKRVLKGELCTGCGLCAGVSGDAISMETVAPGYSRPNQIKTIDAATENRIAAACPGAVVAPWENSEIHKGAQLDPFWGPYFACQTGHAVDKRVRHAGSSGGAISALAIHAVRNNLADAVLQVAADPDQPTRNIVTLSTSEEEIISRSGSRYAASSPLEQIDKHLAGKLRFVFIGKPCDVSALRQLALVDKRVDAQFPVKLSFFCAGVPSHAGADRIIRAMGLDENNVTDFRYRGNGWPGLTRAETSDGKVAEMRYEDSWGGHLSKEVQFRCKICPDGVGGTADIACADAWYGGETGYPQFEEADGRSLIMSRTQSGKALLESAIAADDLAVEDLDIAKIMEMQPSQARRKSLASARITASRIMAQPVPEIGGLLLAVARRKSGLKAQLKDLLGTMRRIILNKR